jgi:glycerol-3-phosphate dehydrogenase
LNDTWLDRHHSLERLKREDQLWDLAVIGGGATGIAIALDAASRGLDVVLLERSDFGKGTSSRSTKLIHGGVRYLRQGNITLVRDALSERTRLLNNAPHCVHDLSFLIPCHSRFERWFYGIGLRLYDLLARGNQVGRTVNLTAEQAMQRVPTLGAHPLRGGVVYQDGQFDDCRLLMSMAVTAAAQGACLINYCGVTGLSHDHQGKVAGCLARDAETGAELRVSAKAVINAAGPFCDSVRQIEDSLCEKMLAVSQGVHLVLPRKFLPCDTAIMVPKTDDGRVIFVIPWQRHTLVGTTDTPIDHPVMEPAAQTQEIDFLLETSGRYLTIKPTRKDVLSVYVGIRPLVKGDSSSRTASLSRDHAIRVSPSGLITITGGKWTTVRKMAEDCVDRAIESVKLRPGSCRTKQLRLRDLDGDHDSTGDLQRLHSDWDFTVADVRRYVRQEMARGVEDVLARRQRVLFLDAVAAVQMAEPVARVMAEELGRDHAWCERQVAEFTDLARNYRLA